MVDTCRHARGSIILLLLILVAACANPPTPSVSTPPSTPYAAGMVDLHELAPDIVIDMRYAGSDNFVGAPIDGYEAPKCFLHRSAAIALYQVQLELAARQARLRVFDCYRPQRAVRHFIRWANDSRDQRTKTRYYPTIDKSQLLGDYIAPISGHSRGATVDLSIEECKQGTRQCQLLDMGTEFDRFGTLAHTVSAQVGPPQRANRLRLCQIMRRHGFVNYPLEWWHFTHQPEPTPATYFDFPVR